MLGIANSKSRFKVIKACDPELVEAIRQATCMRFRLNSDQEFVLNEVTKWFVPKHDEPSQHSKGPRDSLTESQKENNDDFDIIGMEDAISDDERDTKAIKALEMAKKQSDANIVLVHGAFGCGKSYLLVSIIRFISTLLDQIEETDSKILVCALTNVAVDRILLTLKDQGFTDFARVGSLKKIDKQLLPFTHTSSSNKKKADTDALKELKNMMKEIEATCGPGGRMTQAQFEEAKSIQDCID